MTTLIEHQIMNNKCLLFLAGIVSEVIIIFSSNFNPAIAERRAFTSITAEPDKLQCQAVGSPMPSDIRDLCIERCPQGISLKCSKTDIPYSDGTCSINLPISLCERLGISTSIIQPGNLKSALNCSGLGEPFDMQVFYNCCGVLHELVHACNSRRYRTMIACEERDGNTAALECMQEPIGNVCNSGVSSASCHDLCYLNALFAIARIWDNCNCNVAATARDCETPFDKKACCNCNIECVTNPDSYLNRIPQVCKQALTPEDMGKLKNECKSFSAGNHNCNYMAGDLFPDEYFCPDMTPVPEDGF